jgi:hypothetical protein
MTDAALHAGVRTAAAPARPKLDRGMDPRQAIVFLLLIGVGLFFMSYSLYSDVAESGTRTTTFLHICCSSSLC